MKADVPLRLATVIERRRGCESLAKFLLTRTVRMS